MFGLFFVVMHTWFLVISSVCFSYFGIKMCQCLVKTGSIILMSICLSVTVANLGSPIIVQQRKEAILIKYISSLRKK